MHLAADRTLCKMPLMHEKLLRNVVVAHPLAGHRVQLRFDDGLEGDLDLDPVIGEFTGVFAPLADPAEFSLLRVDPECGTICWPNGANIDPVVLYCALKGIPVPSFEERSAPAAQTHPRRCTTSRRETAARAATCKPVANPRRGRKAKRTSHK